jgi:hypothetical protein
MANVPLFPLRVVQGYHDFRVGRMPTERDRYREPGGASRRTL